MNDRILHHYLEEFRAGIDVCPSEAESLYEAMIAGDNQFLLAELLAAWNAKGTSDDEVFEFATIMRARMTRISCSHPTFIDIVGTGGSRAKTFNVSTAAAFIVAGAGLAVAKHGNKAATSSSGSADVLADLGIKIDVEPTTSEKCLNDLGICFMYAPLFHKLSPTLANARRSLKLPTIFNNLGPLCNPAGAEYKMIGVWSEPMVEQTARVLAKLGTKGAWIVHGEVGLDEIALNGSTMVADVRNGGVKLSLITAAEFGVSGTNGGSPSSIPSNESAALIREILENQRTYDDTEKLVLMNAAAALVVASSAMDLRSGYEMAVESLRSGKALHKLKALAAATNK